MNYKNVEIILNNKLKSTNVIITIYKNNTIKNYSKPLSISKIKKLLIIYYSFNNKINIELSDYEIYDLNILKNICEKIYTEEIFDNDKQLYILFNNLKIYDFFNKIENYLNNELLIKNKLIKYVIGDLK